MTPEIIICIEGGNVTHVATSKGELCYRVLDFDNIKVGINGMCDYEADADNVNIEKHTKMLLEDV